MACVPLLSRRNRYQFEAIVLLHSLTAVPYVNAVTFAKLRLVNTRNSSQYSPRVEIRNNRVLWDTEHRFICRFRSNTETNVLESNMLKISIRMETKGGKSFHKVGYVSVNLACFAAMGSATCRRRYILEGYDGGEHKRQDNSLLLVSFSLRQLHGDTCFRIPAENLAKCLVEPSPSSAFDPTGAREEVADDVGETILDGTVPSSASGSFPGCRQNAKYAYPKLCSVLDASHRTTVSRPVCNRGQFSTIPRTSPTDLFQSQLNSQPNISTSSVAMSPETLFVQLASLQTSKVSPLSAVSGRNLLLSAHDAGDSATCVSCNQHNAAAAKGDSVATLLPLQTSPAVSWVDEKEDNNSDVIRPQCFPSVRPGGQREEECRSPSCPWGEDQSSSTASYSPQPSETRGTDKYQPTDSPLDSWPQQKPPTANSIAASIQPSDVSLCTMNSISPTPCGPSTNSSTVGDAGSPPLAATVHDLVDSPVGANGCRSLPNYYAKHQHRQHRSPAVTGLRLLEEHATSDYFATDSVLLMPSRRRRIRVDLPALSPATDGGPLMHGYCPTGLVQRVTGLVDGQSSSSGYVSHSRQSSSDSQGVAQATRHAANYSAPIASNALTTPVHSPPSTVTCQPQTPAQVPDDLYDIKTGGAESRECAYSTPELLKVTF